jgi:N-acetyl-gamma-glutamyl-phosphate reductase
MSKHIKAAIVGAAGYTGGEVLRLLVGHPNISSIIPVSSSSAGQAVTNIHSDLIGDIQLSFVSQIEGSEDVIFLCLPHGESSKWMKKNNIDESQLVVDLGQDHRLLRKQFIYGLTEVNKKQIGATKRIANPGCFATLVQLMLIPFAQQNLLPETIEIAATTGSTGAGQNPTAQTHFSWRAGNHSAYKNLAHQHLAEITATLTEVQPNWNGTINMIPLRGSFTRGIHSVIHFPIQLSEKEITNMLNEYCTEHAFVHTTSDAPSVKQVVNTNKCFIHAEKVNDRVVLTGVIDNLLKGASGQAVQNMNIAFGLPETTGLKLKPLAY